jgi:DNA polymerase III delta subunit
MPPSGHPMTISPLAYFWGDDDFVIGRTIDRLIAALGAELGVPPDRWDPWSEPRTPSQHVAVIAERLTTATMFGGGTFVVLRQPGLLIRKNDDRDVLVEAIGNVVAGNGLAIVDAHDGRTPKGKRRFAPHKRVADAVEAAGGLVRAFEPPSGAGFVAFIEGEATTRGLTFDGGAAAELASRVGGSTAGDDIERRFQTRRASMEIDKLALYRPDRPISIDDVRDLVPAEIPGSLFGLTDAVGMRQVKVAIEALDKIVETTPEPVLLVMLHRRIRDLLEVKDRGSSGESRAEIVAATKLHPFVAEKMEAQTRNWTISELTDALDGLVEIDAMVKGVPGSSRDAVQRRLAFTLWVMDHVPRRERRSA